MLRPRLRGGLTGTGLTLAGLISLQLLRIRAYPELFLISMIVVILGLSATVLSLGRKKVVAPGPFCPAGHHDLAGLPDGAPCPECG